MTFNPDDYEVVPPHSALLAHGLMKIWERLGKPDDCSNEVGWIMLDQIVNCWTVNYRQEVEDWQHDRAIDLANEISMTDLKKKDGGYNPITFPPTLFQLIKAMLPLQNMNDKKFQRKLSMRHNLFKTTNFGL